MFKVGKVYIAGKITGTKDYMERFSRAENWLNENGYRNMVINPAKISDGLPNETTTYSDYIRIGLSMLDTCDSIFMLRGWEDSPGALLELQYAVTLGYEIIYEEDVEGEEKMPCLHENKHEMVKQKIMGIIFLLSCVWILIASSRARVPGDLDVTPVLMLAPLGFGLLFSKECWLY